MAHYKSDIIDIDLNNGKIHRSFLNHSIGHMDNNADRFGVRVFRDGVAEDLSGTSCQAVFMAPDGQNIALTSHGTVEGNEAYVTLPQACYNVEGQFCLAIKLIGGGVTGTVRIVDGVVDRTGATGTVAPTESVPTYQEILAVYAEMQQDVVEYEGVVASQNQKITDLESASRCQNTFLLQELGKIILNNYIVPKGSTQKEITSFDAAQGKLLKIDIKLKAAMSVKIYFYLLDSEGNNIFGSTKNIGIGETFGHWEVVPDADYSGVRLCCSVSNSATTNAVFEAVVISQNHGEMSDVINRNNAIIVDYSNHSNNILDNTHTGWVSNSNGVSIQISKDRADITLLLDENSSSAKYFYNRVNVSGISSIVITCDIYGTGRGYIRIGSINEQNTITWIVNNVDIGTAYNVSAYDEIVIALQVADSSSYNAGTYNLFRNLQVQSGLGATEYEYPFSFCDNDAREKIEQVLTPFVNLLPLDASKYTTERCSISIGKDGTIIATATETGSWVSAQTPVIEVSAYKYICAFWKTHNSGVSEKRMLRVGSWTGSQVEWLGFIPGNGGSIDLTGIRRIVIRLYINNDTIDEMEAGEQRIYEGITIQPGTVAKYYPYDTYPFKIPDYYFTGNYLDNKVDTINGKLNECAANGDAFIFITDMHTNGQNRMHSPALIKYVSEYTGINKLFDGGDDTDGPGTKTPMILRRSINGEAHFLTGNHDTFDYTGGNELYRQYDIPLSNQVGNNFERYYYVDNPQTKFRYICLSSYTRNTDPEVDTALSNLTQEQLNWFTNTALNVQSGWTIVVLAHALYKINLANNSLSLETGADAFINAIDSYSGPGEIACVMLGHSHRDRIVYTNSGVPIILTTCDKNKPYVSKTSGAVDLDVDRTTGTRMEQAFDVCVVDTFTKTVTAYRVGCNARNGVGSDPGSEVQYREVSYQ